MAKEKVFESGEHTFKFKSSVSDAEAMRFIDNYLDGQQMSEDGDAPLYDKDPKTVQTLNYDPVDPGSDVPTPEALEGAVPLPKKDWMQEANREMMRIPGVPMVTSLAAGINKGTMMLADLPANLTNMALEVAGVEGKMHTIAGALNDVQTKDGVSLLQAATGQVEDAGVASRMVHRIGEEIGATGAGTLLALRGARFLYQAAKFKNPLKSYNTLSAAVANNPATFARREMALGVGAGTGAAGAIEATPESAPQGVKTAAEITGMLAGGGAVAVGTTPLGFAWKHLKKQTTDPFTDAGVRQRLSDFLLSETSDPEQAARNIRANRALFKDEFGEQMDVPADMLSKDSGLMRAISGLSAKDPKLLGKLNKMHDDALEVASRKTSQILPEGSPEDAINFVNNKIARVTRVVDDNLALLEDQAEKRVQALRDPRPAESLSEEFMEQIEVGFGKAKEIEKALWTDIPEAGGLDTTSLKQSFGNIRKAISRTTKSSNVPREELLLALGKGGLRRKDSINNVINLRSEILESQRKAKSDGNFAKARILGQMESSVGDFIETAGKSQEYRKAANFTRMIHDRYTRGYIGKLRGYDPKGGEKVNHKEALNAVIRKGEKGAATAEDLNRLAHGIDGKATVEEALDPVYGYVRNAFTAAGADIGKQAKFLEDYGPLLRQFPNLQRQLVDEQKTFERFANRIAALEGRRGTIYDKRKVAAASLLETDPSTLGQRLASMSPERTRRIMRTLGQNTEAQLGAKASAGEHLLERIISPETGLPSVQKILRNPKLKNVYDNVLDAQQRKYINELSRQSEILLKHRPGMAGKTVPMPPVAALMYRVLGAGGGIGLAKRFGSGSNLIAASAGSKLLTGLTQNATDSKLKDLVLKAVGDPDMMADLLEPTTAQNVNRQVRQIHAWLYTIGHDIDEQEE